MWLLADMMQTGMLLAGIALLIFVLMRRTYRHYGRRRSTRQARIRIWPLRRDRRETTARSATRRRRYCVGKWRCRKPRALSKPN